MSQDGSISRADGRPRRANSTESCDVYTFPDDLLDSLRATLTELGLHTPTEIQARVLPEMLARRSVVGIAETGSGKTLAYVLPALQLTKTLETVDAPITEPGRPRALIVTPTRELADQVTRVFKGFTHGTRVRVRTVVGATMAIARRNVSAPFEILVATPGRLGQLVDVGAVDLSDVRLVVLDEADQLLDLGFLPEVARVVKRAPPSRQMALFSATLPAPVEALIPELFHHPPPIVKTAGSHRVVPTLVTDHRRVVDGKRFEVLVQLLREPSEASGTLIFTNTRAQCDRLANELATAGFPAAMYRGEMERAERKTNLANFREGRVKLLVATDLGARGLDVEAVDRVVNYHLPQDIGVYLHRVGRTARAGRAGVVVNLVTERDEPLLERVERLEPGGGPRPARRRSPTRGARSGGGRVRRGPGGSG